MNKSMVALLFVLSLASALIAAEEPDIIYVNGKPVYIEGIQQPNVISAPNKSLAIAAEAARSKAPSNIYRGTVLGANEGKEIYRGTVFGQEDKEDAPQDRTINNSKTKLVYDTSLVRAVKMNDADRVRTLIYANVDVNERNYAGMTPLTIAAEKGNLTIVKRLVEDGAASVNMTSSYNLTPLITAAAAGHRDVVEFLLENGADPTIKDDLGKTALHHAMGSDDKKMTEALVNQNTRALNFPDNDGNTPLIYAAQRGLVNNLKVLLKHNANVNYQNPISGFTALASAASAGQEQAAKILVDNGADVEQIDHDGRTALFYAAEHGQTSLMKQLQKMGANMYATDKSGMNIFNAAVQAQSIPSLRYLAPKYFDVNSTDAQGLTPLMYAAKKETDSLQWLLDNGADVNAKDRLGNTALMHAITNGNEKAALLLLKENVDLSATNQNGENASTLAQRLMPKSNLLTVMQVKKNTLQQQQLNARQKALALAQQEQEKIQTQASNIAANKKAEIKQLEKQLKKDEALVKQLQQEQVDPTYQAIRAEVEQEYTEADEELARLQKQLAEAKARREAQINAKIQARMQEVDEALSVE